MEKKYIAPQTEIIYVTPAKYLVNQDSGGEMTGDDPDLGGNVVEFDETSEINVPQNLWDE